MKAHDTRLQQELITRGLLKAAEASRIEQEVTKNKISLKEAVLKLGAVKEEQFLAVEAEVLSVPFLDLDNYLIDAKVLRMIPERVARAHQIMPVYKLGKLSIATADPMNLLALDEVKEAAGQEIDIVLSSREMIVRAINQYYGGLGPGGAALNQMLTAPHREGASQGLDFAVADKKSDPGSSPGAKEGPEEIPVIQLVNQIIQKAIEDKASDIHIEPEEDSVRIRNRVDGLMHEADNFPKRLHLPIASRIKIMAQLDIAEARKPQDGKFRLKIGSQDLDIRVSTFPTMHGENIVLRLLEQSKMILGMQDLGMSLDMIGKFEILIRKSYGMVLVTGPTGSGKTTSLYAAVTKINSIDKNIITIEDPVEYQVPIVRQTQVNVKAGLTFANGLRSILRQDPDVVLVGEIRDSETASIAVEAALTGHLVFSTIHTNDAAGAVTRLLDMDMEPFLISSALVGVLAQRLVRTICSKCKESYPVNPETVRKMGVQIDATTFFRGKGCAECKNTGYQHRIGIFELLVVDEAIRNLISKRATAREIKDEAVKRGMSTMRQDGVRKAAAGYTTLAEVMKATQEED